MNEKDLLVVWGKLRTQLVVSQLAPTFLLITTVGLVSEIRSAGEAVAWATVGILLASGILGALVQFSSSSEAQAVATELAKATKHSRLAKTISANARALDVAKFVTPTIFVAIFVALCTALFSA